MIYRYVGVNSEVGDREFSVVGQKAEFSDVQYRGVVIGGAAFISEDDWEIIEFTEAETSLYGQPYYFGTYSDEYTHKVALARDRFKEIRDKFMAEDAAPHFN